MVTLVRLSVRRYDNGRRPSGAKRKALLHGHCQHKAIMKLDSEEKLLEKMGLELEKPDSGCCGMAGGFGYEKELTIRFR